MLDDEGSGVNSGPDCTLDEGTDKTTLLDGLAVGGDVSVEDPGGIVDSGSGEPPALARPGGDGLLSEGVPTTGRVGSGPYLGFVPRPGAALATLSSQGRS